MSDAQHDFKEDDMWRRWQEQQAVIYDEVYYNSNFVVTYFNRVGHSLLEKPYRGDKSFSKVLEVGAGTGEHLDFVRHSFDQYFLTDINEEFLEKAKKRHQNEKVVFEKQDASALDYPDDSFDRLISVYNLEHLPNPHLILKEWKRVVKKGGVISIAIPAEGGIAWNLGRFLTTRRYFRNKGLDLDYIISREHINACYRLVNFINHYFSDKQRTWFPFRVPLTHVNLLYACNVTNT